MHGTKDISVFVLEETAKYGGPSMVATNGAGNSIAHYVYSEDPDGFQVMCEGNKVTAFEGIFQPYLGNPMMAKTNADGLSAFVYGNHGIGVSINCGLDSETVFGKKRDITHLVVVRSGAIK
jgi:hypothetical protein